VSITFSASDTGEIVRGRGQHRTCLNIYGSASPPAPDISLVIIVFGPYICASGEQNFSPEEGSSKQIAFSTHARTSRPPDAIEFGTGHSSFSLET
jgi:hypothetical protein